MDTTQMQAGSGWMSLRLWRYAVLAILLAGILIVLAMYGVSRGRMLLPQSLYLNLTLGHESGKFVKLLHGEYGV
jgi:hypothetical protein